MSFIKQASWIEQHLFTYNPNKVDEKIILRIREGLKKFSSEEPELSIVIPAYNEEAFILNTLSSFASMDLPCKVELIVANNNSTDQTGAILKACAVQSVHIPEQGISYARQGGMEAAKANIILSADSDSLYPPNWISPYFEAFKNAEVVCAYGSYSFIPSAYASRLTLSFYEFFSTLKFNMRKEREACKNVMGFNFAYRKDKAIEIGGFKHDLNRAVTARSEDGWMAWELYELGKLFKIASKYRVWTDTRRLEEDGTILSAFSKRIKSVLN